MPDDNEIKKYYMVTVVRYGCVAVEAGSEAEAMDIANHQTTDAVNWSDDWTPTDAQEEEYDPHVGYADSYMFD